MRKVYGNYIINSIRWEQTPKITEPHSSYCNECGSYFGRDKTEVFYDIEHSNGRVVNLSVAYCSEVCCSLVIDRMMNTEDTANPTQEEATED